MPHHPCYTKLAYIESENPTEGGKFFLIDPADIDELPEASHVWSVGEEIQYRVIKTGELVQDDDGPYVQADSASLIQANIEKTAIKA